MIDNLKAMFDRYGFLTVRDIALEVAFTGESWREVCDQAEAVGAAKPGCYHRLLEREDGPRSLMRLCSDAFQDIDVVVCHREGV